MEHKHIIKKGVLGIKKGFSAFFHSRLMRHGVAQVVFLAVMMNLIVETCSRFSLLKAFGYLFMHPLIFLTNTFIIALIIAPSLLFHRRVFFYTFTCMLWLAVGIIDFVLLHNRVTPFNANDFHMLGDAVEVAFHYYTILQLILLGALILFAVLLIIFAFFKLPKRTEKFNYKRTIPAYLLLSAICVIGIRLSLQVGIMAKTFPNLANAYHDYGLPYCFSFSIIDKGIDKPSDYSPEIIDNMVKPLSVTPVITNTPNATVNSPNVIFIQLESLFDPKRIKGIEFASDPIPTLTYLRENYTSGLLTVPSISAGTANTEFEVLCGMNMADFGTGEYPFKTILKTHTAESIAFNLKQLGYATHAIHDNTATFYSRHIVFGNLGFDDFDPVELMPNVERNELNWAKDAVLYDEILTALNCTEARDLVFTVSVQGHGGYPDEDILNNTIDLVDVYDAYADNTIYGLKYYITQLNEMDNLIARLVEYLSDFDEETVLVLYGDHLPGFDFSEDDLTYGNLMQTEYVIWSNFDMPVEHIDLHSYQLSAYVQSRLGYSEGLLTRLHQSYFSDPTSDEYLEELTMLSYDMLYGDMFCWGGENPYTATDIQYGFREITLDSIHAIYDKEKDKYYLQVFGTNLTPYTDIYINGKRHKETIYVSEQEVFLSELTLEDGDEIQLAMPIDDTDVLRASNVYIFHP